MRDITVNLACPIEGRRVLLLGAGGAARGGHRSLARGAAAPARRRQPHGGPRRRRWPKRSGNLGPISAAGFSALAGQTFDVVIDATSASLAGAGADLLPLPDGLFAPGSLAYAMMYGKGETVFQRLAKAQGAARVAEGLGMLLEQAAEAFFLWRGVRPDVAPVMTLLRGA